MSDRKGLEAFSKLLLKLFSLTPMKWVDAESPIRKLRRAQRKEEIAEGQGVEEHPEKE